MKIDPDIAEMLHYATQHPYTDMKNITQYQRQFADGLTITLFLDGRVSLTAKQKLEDAETARVIVTLASLSCLLKGVERQGEYFIYRYRFYNPLIKNPIFRSELDQYLSQPFSPETQSYQEKQVRRPESKPAPLYVSPPASPEQLRPLPTPPVKAKLYWDELPEDRCHICHRQLTDPESIRVSIGPICRGKIETANEKGSEMWDDINRQELERIRTTHSTYARSPASTTRVNHAQHLR